MIETTSGAFSEWCVKHGVQLTAQQRYAARGVISSLSGMSRGPGRKLLLRAVDDFFSDMEAKSGGRGEDPGAARRSRTGA